LQLSPQFFADGSSCHEGAKHSCFALGYEQVVLAALRSMSEPGIYSFGMLALLSILLGFISWKYIETPFRAQHPGSRRKTFIHAAIGSSFFMIIGVCGCIADGFPQRLPASSSPFLSAINDRNPRQSECHFGAATFPRPQDSCILGDAQNLQGALL
ncbi:hypothetical protein, partial [Paracidovorax avenae]|uniref:hypothetical protein n=1 Tax=Paracidovorax avenae TaxID=80867 RepID=UPI001F2DB2A4